MPHPRLKDDGQTVTLDLHGATVSDALYLATSAVVEAARHGRQTVRLVHGSSTFDAGADQTIKGALHRALDHGRFDRHVTSDFKGETMLTLGLAPAPSPLQKRIRLADLH